MVCCEWMVQLLFGLTNGRRRFYLRGMNIDKAGERIRFAYPQIYYACHTRHVRRRSSATALSDRDSTILVHLDPRRPTSLGELAQHMDLAKSTLSEALKRLESLGHVTKMAQASMRAGKRGRSGIVLTSKGVTAVLDSSVLDAERLALALGRMKPLQRSEVARAMVSLARACRGVALRVDR